MLRRYEGDLGALRLEEKKPELVVTFDLWLSFIKSFIPPPSACHTKQDHQKCLCMCPYTMHRVKPSTWVITFSQWFASLFFRLLSLVHQRQCQIYFFSILRIIVPIQATLWSCFYPCLHHICPFLRFLETFISCLTSAILLLTMINCVFRNVFLGLYWFLNTVFRR